MAVPPSSERNARLAQLLARIARGDQAAFGDLYCETSGQLYGGALHILRDTAAAEDIVQEAYVSVWQHAGSYEVAKSQPLTWLTTIVRNRCLDQVRGRARAAATSPDDDGGVPVPGIPADAVTPVEILVAAAPAAPVRECLATLDAEQRQAIALAYYHGLSHAELAAQLREPVGTVKSRVRRALARLRHCVDRAGDARPE